MAKIKPVLEEGLAHILKEYRVWMKGDSGMIGDDLLQQARFQNAHQQIGKALLQHIKVLIDILEQLPGEERRVMPIIHDPSIQVAKRACALRNGEKA